MKRRTRKSALVLVLCFALCFGSSFLVSASTGAEGSTDGRTSVSDNDPGTDTPGVSDNDPGTDTPGTDTPGTDTPGTDTPGVSDNDPGTDTPGTDTPGTDTPGTDTPGTSEPTVEVVDKVDDVVDTLEKSEGNVVVVVIPENPVIEASTQTSIFEAIKGTDKAVSFSFATEDNSTVAYQWTFLGSDKMNTAATIKDFKVEAGKTSSGAAHILEEQGAPKDSVGLHFSHDGALPGIATVSVKVDLADGQMYLYYVNPETRKLELVTSEAMVKDGYATFSIDHCSDYVLTKTPVVPVSDDSDDDDDDDNSSNVQNSNNNNAKSPKTGE